MKNEVYAKRVLHLRHTCQNSSRKFIGRSSDERVMHNILIEEHHKLIYCEVQKVGSTFINGLLRRLVYNSTIQKKNPGFERLLNRKDLRFEMLNSVINNFDKFMFVRDPYRRLLSGYVDKLVSPNGHWGFIGTYIISTIRKGADAVSISCGNDVKFTEFIKYVIESEKSGRQRNIHFTPVYEHCSPCQLPYDFVGKMETFKEDILFLLDGWNKLYGSSITFDDFESETALAQAINQCNRLFEMQKTIRRCTTFYNVSLRVWRDLQIRGILPIQEAFPFTSEFTEHNMTKADLIKSVTKAIKSVTNITALKAQRKEVFIEAFSLLPMEDLYKLQRIYQSDFILFNYDSSPPEIFNRKKNKKKSLRYFDIL